MLKIDDVAVFTLEVFLAKVVNDWLAVLLLLVCTLVPVNLLVH